MESQNRPKLDYLQKKNRYTVLDIMKVAREAGLLNTIMNMIMNGHY